MALLPASRVRPWNAIVEGVTRESDPAKALKLIEEFNRSLAKKSVNAASDTQRNISLTGG